MRHEPGESFAIKITDPSLLQTPRLEALLLSKAWPIVAPVHPKTSACYNSVALLHIVGTLQKRLENMAVCEYGCLPRGLNQLCQAAIQSRPAFFLLAQLPAIMCNLSHDTCDQPTAKIQVAGASQGRGSCSPLTMPRQSEMVRVKSRQGREGCLLSIDQRIQRNQEGLRTEVQEEALARLRHSHSRPPAALQDLCGHIRHSRVGPRSGGDLLFQPAPPQEHARTDTEVVISPAGVACAPILKMVDNNQVLTKAWIILCHKHCVALGADDSAEKKEAASHAANQDSVIPAMQTFCNCAISCVSQQAAPCSTAVVCTSKSPENTMPLRSKGRS